MGKHVNGEHGGDVARLGLLTAAVAMVVAIALATVVTTSGNGVITMVFRVFLLAFFGAGLAAAVALRSRRPPSATEAPVAEALPGRDTLERLALRIAAEHDGYVTPEALVVGGQGLTLAAARELLDDLAVSGGCEVDSDEEGHLTYRFRTRVAPVRDEASPAEWVDSQAQRLTGQTRTTGQRLDA